MEQKYTLKKQIIDLFPPSINELVLTQLQWQERGIPIEILDEFNVKYVVHLGSHPTPVYAGFKHDTNQSYFNISLKSNNDNYRHFADINKKDLVKAIQKSVDKFFNSQS